MTISAVWVWLITALVLGGSEILTGTFYLLVLAVSCLAGAVAAGINPADTKVEGAVQDDVTAFKVHL